MFRIVVAGCRYYNNYEEAKQFIDECICEIQKQNRRIIFLSGGCRGADTLGERFAQENGLEIEKHPADWKRYGRAAGPKRNKEMIENCDMVICFWDGKSKGTGSAINYAKRLEKTLFIKEI